MKGIIVGWDIESEEPLANCTVRRLLREAAAAFGENGIERFFPSTAAGLSAEDLASEALAAAASIPDDDAAPANLPPRALELLCLLNRVLFNLVQDGGRRHDPMVVKYLGGRLRRYWRFTLKLDGSLGAELWLPETAPSALPDA